MHVIYSCSFSTFCFGAICTIFLEEFQSLLILEVSTLESRQNFGNMKSLHISTAGECIFHGMKSGQVLCTSSTLSLVTILKLNRVTQILLLLNFILNHNTINRIEEYIVRTYSGRKKLVNNAKNKVKTRVKVGEKIS